MQVLRLARVFSLIQNPKHIYCKKNNMKPMDVLRENKTYILVAAVAMALSSFITDMLGNQRSDYQQIIELRTQENDRLRVENQSLRLEVWDLREEVCLLRSEVRELKGKLGIE